MKRFSQFISVAGILTLGLAAVPPFARADSPATTQPSEQGRTEGMHGAGKLIEKALGEVDLRPDQKDAVEAMKARAKERHAPVKAARGEFAKVVADQVESGKIDRCALAPKIEAIASATAQAHPGDRADFERLHSILDPDQRTTFVDALKRQWESIEKMHEPSALAEKMATKLNLSSDQKASLEKILTGLREIREAEPSYAKHRERWAKILDAFKSDHFVLDEVAPMGDVAAHTTARVEHMLWAGEAILPLLTSDQRKAVGDKLREAANKMGSQSGSVSPSMSPSEEEE
jgi:hypothetical protein